MRTIKSLRLGLFAGTNPERFLFCLAIACMTAGEARSEDSILVDSRSIDSQVELFWNTLSTLEFRCEESASDTGGRIDRTRPFARYDYRSASGAKRSLTSYNVFPDGKIEVTKCFKENGQTRHDITPFSTDASSIAAVTTRSETNTQEEYNDVMFSCMVLLFPGGRSIPSWIGPDAQLSRTEVDGQSMVELVVKHPKTKRLIRCTLDPGHDWLARKVLLGSGKGEKFWIVEEFQRDNGRWFPARGRFSASTSTGLKPFLFEISNLKINRIADESQFVLPALPDGVFVQDQRSGQQSIKGGVEAGKRLRERYVPITNAAASDSVAERPNDVGKSHSPLLAEQYPPRFPWIVLPLIVAMVAIAMAVFWSWKNSRG